jgi:tRNA uracil 4-sulfurtransferase
MKVLVHYSEIGLKGRNRRFFESKLIENIKSKLKTEKILIKNKRILIESKETKTKLIEKLSEIFGISSFSFIEEVESVEDKIVKKVVSLVKKLKIRKLSLVTKRSDKKFPLTSVELNKKIGSEVGVKINFKEGVKVFTEVTKSKTYIYFEKFKGLNGLPVGSSGKVVCLFSGGIDSCVAAYLMMKRGCKVDFLHFHALRNVEEVKKSKIFKLLNSLNKYQNNSKLHCVSYLDYQLSVKVDERYDVVVFKNFMLKYADSLKDYKGIVTGDSLGQVASQTLDNLKSSKFKIDNLILSPLMGMDKQEIIELAKKIGTYEDSIKEYKDCCSIISKKPSTSVKVFEIERLLDFDELIKKSEVSCIKI